MLWISSQKLTPFWWLEIETVQPQCTYYYGPFKSAPEAESYQHRYVEDFRAEPSPPITVKIRTCQPETLTIISTENSNGEHLSLPEP